MKYYTKKLIATVLYKLAGQDVGLVCVPSCNNVELFGNIQSREENSSTVCLYFGILPKSYTVETGIKEPKL